MNFLIAHSRTAAKVRPGKAKAAASIALVTVAATAFAGCASQEPQVAPPVSQTMPAVVGYVAGDAEQEILAQVYARGFSRVNREAAVLELPDAASRLSAVNNRLVTIGFGCTGELLGLLDPARARELSAEYAADDNPNKEFDPEWRDRVYVAFSESLPGTTMATDPSNAQGCSAVDEDNPGASLPQHVVPFYGKPALTRRDRVEVLNRVAGSLAADDIDDMLARHEEGEAPAEIAQQWVDTSRFATG